MERQTPEENTGIFHACTIETNGTSVSLQGDDISKTVRSEKLAWVHLNGLAPAAREWLEREVSYLDHIILDALLAEETRPRLLDFDKGVVMILRGVNLNQDSRPEDMISLRLWIDPYRIITIERRRSKAIQDMYTALQHATGPKNSGEFLTQLIGMLFDRMEITFSDLSDKLDDIEQGIMESPELSERQQITEIRTQAILFRRYIAPQRDVITHLRNVTLPWLEPIHKRYLQESLDQIIRYTEDLDSMRDRSQVLKDEVTAMLAEQTNKNMYILSVFSAIFLPLSFLTGLMGMNIAGLPGLHSPYAFWIFSGVSLVIVLLQITIFKKLKWF